MRDRPALSQSVEDPGMTGGWPVAASGLARGAAGAGGDRPEIQANPEAETMPRDRGNPRRRARGTGVARVLLLLFLAVALLVDDVAIGLSGQQGVSAQPQGMAIMVYDYTGGWGNRIETGVQRWDAGLAARGIRLTYSRQPPTACENLNQPASGISVCDTEIPHPSGWVADGEHQSIWATENGVQMRGLVRYYRDAPNSSYADNLVCHELGHTLQLPHVANSIDSCMKNIPQRADPSAWDIANALLTMPSDSFVEQKQDGKKAKKDGKKGKKDGKKGKKSKKHRH